MPDVRLRLATPSDGAGVASIYAPVVRETAISFELHEPTADDMADRIATTLPSHPWIVAADDARVLGYAYAGRHKARAAYDWAVETSVYLAEDARGRGLGRRLQVALLDLLRAQGFTTATAGIALPNPASVTLHESLGFTPVGTFHAVGWKLGRWWDVGYWELALGTSGPPTPTVPVTALDQAVVAAALGDPPAA